MATVNTGNTAELQAAVSKWLGEFPGDTICAIQIWYEGLGGQGTAKADQIAAIEAAVAATPGWKHAGDIRYEKFGSQNSFKRS